MRMPLLLADFIYSRDCKLNLRKNVDTTTMGCWRQCWGENGKGIREQPLKSNDFRGCALCAHPEVSILTQSKSRISEAV